MGTAAADVSVKRLRNLRARGLGVFIEQRLGRNQDTGKAIAALAGLLVEKGLLQRMRVFAAAQTLDGDDRFSRDAPDRFCATFLRCTVDQNHATAALFEPAAKAGAHETKFITQHVEERRFLAVGENADGFAVDRKIECFWHARS